MNTTELINEIARRSKSTSHRMSRKEVDHVLTLFLGVVTDELCQLDGDVRLRQFGVFSLDCSPMPNLSHLPNVDSTKNADKMYFRVRFRASAILRQQINKSNQ